MDDVKIYPAGNPGDDHIQNGTFESGSLAPWTVNGNHSTSAITTEDARSGTRSLKITASGAGTGAGAGIVQDGLGLVTNDQYTLEFWVRFDSPDADADREALRLRSGLRVLQGGPRGKRDAGRPELGLRDGPASVHLPGKPFADGSGELVADDAPRLDLG